MNANERNEKLNDYLDGVLSAEEVRAVEAELERDPAFRAEEQALRAMLAEAARLPKGVAPKRDLWPDIEARLSERAPASRSRSVYTTVYRGLVAMAAAVLIFVAGMWYARNGMPEVHAPGVAENSANDLQPPTQVELAGYQEIAREYAGVRASLREALDKARPNLAPETVKVVDDSLATIDRAIDEIETALANDPGNPTLIRSLVAVYDQEVGLLRQMSTIADGPGEKNA